MTVVEHLNVVEHLRSGLRPRGEVDQVNQLALDPLERALHEGTKERSSFAVVLEPMVRFHNSAIISGMYSRSA